MKPQKGHSCTFVDGSADSIGNRWSMDKPEGKGRLHMAHCMTSWFCGLPSDVRPTRFTASEESGFNPLACLKYGQDAAEGGNIPGRVTLHYHKIGLFTRLYSPHLVQDTQGLGSVSSARQNGLHIGQACLRHRAYFVGELAEWVVAPSTIGSAYYLHPRFDFADHSSRGFC